MGGYRICSSQTDWVSAFRQSNLNWIILNKSNFACHHKFTYKVVMLKVNFVQWISNIDKIIMLIQNRIFHFVLQNESSFQVQCKSKSKSDDCFCRQPCIFICRWFIFMMIRLLIEFKKKALNYKCFEIYYMNIIYRKIFYKLYSYM